MPASKVPKEPSAYKVSHLPFASNFTPLTSYLLGLLWADGYVGPLKDGAPSVHTAVRFTTTAPDSDHFTPLFARTGKWGTYVTLPSTTHPTWKIRITLVTRNPYLSDLLLAHRYGAKSIEGPDSILGLIPVALHRYWLLGLVDGDGCFSHTVSASGKRASRFSLASSYDQDWRAVEALLKSLSVRYRLERTRRVSGAYSKLNVTAIPDIKRLGAYLYAEDAETLALPRKREVYQQIVQAFWRRASTHQNISFIGAGATTDIANYAKQFGVKAENVVGYTSADKLEEAFAAV